MLYLKEITVRANGGSSRKYPRDHYPHEGNGRENATKISASGARFSPSSSLYFPRKHRVGGFSPDHRVVFVMPTRICTLSTLSYERAFHRNSIVQVPVRFVNGVADEETSKVLQQRLFNVYHHLLTAIQCRQGKKADSLPFSKAKLK